MADFGKLIIKDNISLINAMKHLDKTSKKILFVVDTAEGFVGSVTDGDIRRWILKGGELDTNIGKVAYPSAFTVSSPYNISQVKEKMKTRDLAYVPVLDTENRIIEILTQEKLLSGSVKHEPSRALNLPVVIMAGGKGSRLDPFTKILPKPLIPVGEKTILEIIIDKFLLYGLNHFHLAVNYKASIIKAYFSELNPNYKISFIHEEKALGTIGALAKIKEKFKLPILLTNCDIIIDADYLDLVNYHNLRKNDITVVVSVKRYNIPYGICKIENGGDLREIIEKPESSYLVNTGMYIISQSALKAIPDDQFFHATHLIDAVITSGGKVGVYPISEDAWADTGEWSEYKKTLGKFIND